MYNETTFTRDAAAVSFDTDSPGISESEDGFEIDWSEVERVTIDNPPHAEAFDSKEFYKIPATVARPINQTYRFADNEVVLKKPREELKRAAWSLDNASWTMDHPDTGMVKRAQDIRGFWDGAHYIDSLDELNSSLHIPVADEEAKEFVEENPDVSVGFYNKVARVDEYDGIIGGEDAADEDVDGYQTNMVFDHVASVAKGRCPGEKGCGIGGTTDSADHGHMSFISGAVPTEAGRDGRDSSTMEGTDASDFVNPDDDRWYAVPPKDNPDDEWKFPITSCDGEDSVDSAWHFAIRERGNISISFETLKDRIKRRASELDCGMELSESTDVALDDMELAGWYSDSHGDCGCGCGGDCSDKTGTIETMQFDIDTDDLDPEAVLDKVADEHDGVSEALDELRAYADAAQEATEAAEELGIEETTDLAEKVGALKDELDELRSFKQDAQREQMKEHAEVIVAATDRFGEDVDEVIDGAESLDDIKDKRELIEELGGSSTDEKTANEGTTDSKSEETAEPGGYAATPW